MTHRDNLTAYTTRNPGRKAICACIHPDELQTGYCGVCKLPRIGDDLTPTQLDRLTDAVARMLHHEDRMQRLVRVHGRRRPDTLHHPS